MIIGNIKKVEQSSYYNNLSFKDIDMIDPNQYLIKGTVLILNKEQISKLIEQNLFEFKNTISELDINIPNIDASIESRKSYLEFIISKSQEKKERYNKIAEFSKNQKKPQKRKTLLSFIEKVFLLNLFIPGAGYLLFKKTNYFLSYLFSISIIIFVIFSSTKNVFVTSVFFALINMAVSIILFFKAFKKQMGDSLIEYNQWPLSSIIPGIFIIIGFFNVVLLKGEIFNLFNDYYKIILNKISFLDLSLLYPQTDFFNKESLTLIFIISIIYLIIGLFIYIISIIARIIKRSL